MIDAMRALIARAVPAAVESVKWNAPSFATREHFATFHLRSKAGVQLVLHLGARPKQAVDMRDMPGMDTPLLEWKGPDRAIVTIRDAAHLVAVQAPLTRIVRAWAKHLTIVLFAVMVTASAAFAQPTAASPPQIRAAAFDVMRAARYCTLITIGADGQPQARVVDPLVVEDEGLIWIATNPLTRKVGEIKRDSRVTLMFFNAAASEYVTVLARASVVTDVARQRAHWKAEWQPFYKGGAAGPDFMLFEVKPYRLEISSPRHKLNNDPNTWRPVILELP